MILKIAVDMGMTIAFLFLMAYELIGQAAHEWIGMGMFLLFVLHHALNWKWSRNLMKGRYTRRRAIQTALVTVIFATMVGSMVSGVILSRHVLVFLPIEGGRSFARKLHMLSAYWGFAFMSIHLGFHWSVMMGLARKAAGEPSPARTWILRLSAVLIAGYGVYAFIKREIGSYMLLQIQFVFFDFEEPVVFFLLDYAAAMGLFVFAGHYLSECLKKNGNRKNGSNAD